MSAAPTPTRLVSLDVFRGITMFLLIGDSAGVFHAFSDATLDGSFLGAFVSQFHHHPWNGLRFWDLVQPFFMFIVGVAMPFSFGRRWERGDSYTDTLKHALLRSAILHALGVGVYVVAAGHLTLELWNVLAQLSVTYLIAFLLMRQSLKVQLAFTIGILLLSEGLYRFWAVPGFDQPFTPSQNFGAWVDLLLMGKLSGGHWVAFNAIPTTAHTMWGVMAGIILKSDRAVIDKIKPLLIAGLIGIVVGYGLDPVTPIIKRICTTSFVIVSGGWCLLALALCYWIVDVKGFQKGIYVPIIFGMNPLTVYLFGEVAGNKWLRSIVSPFAEGFLGWMGTEGITFVTALIVLGINTYALHWLYKKRIFIKI